MARELNPSDRDKIPREELPWVSSERKADSPSQILRVEVNQKSFWSGSLCSPMQVNLSGHHSALE